MDPIFLMALPTFIVLVFLLAPLGCFLMWQRMAFLSDTLSHGAVLGVAIGTLLNINLTLSNFIYITIFVVLLKFLLNRKTLSKDSVLAILSYGGMSLGFVLLKANESDSSFEEILLGNILTVNTTELTFLLILTAVVILFLFKYRKQLVTLILDKDLAKTSGVRVDFLENALLLLTAFSVAFAMQCVGAIVVPALLIIPSCSVRIISSSYKNMIIFSVLFAAIMMPLSVLLIKKFDTPFGPSVVLTYIAGFLILQTLYKFYKMMIIKKSMKLS
jgi:zinc transport system permease protein